MDSPKRRRIASFALIKSAEFEVIRRVSRDLGWRPAKVVKHKYDKDILALYFYHFRRLLHEADELERLEKERKRLERKLDV